MASTEVLSVPDISCGHCKSAIEGALSPLTGVTQATVDVDSKAVTVIYDDAAIDRERLQAAIEEAGYRVA